MCLIEKLRLENRTNNLTTEIHLFKGKIYHKIHFEFLYILIKMSYFRGTFEIIRWNVIMYVSNCIPPLVNNGIVSSFYIILIFQIDFFLCVCIVKIEKFHQWRRDERWLKYYHKKLMKSLQSMSVCKFFLQRGQRCG